MNETKTAIKLFEQKQLRSSWNKEEEKWYFSIIDVIEILTDSPRPRKYWNALKTKLIAEGSELSQNLGQLKMKASDGKYYKTDIADTENANLKESLASLKALNVCIEYRYSLHVLSACKNAILCAYLCSEFRIFVLWKYCI